MFRLSFDKMLWMLLIFLSIAIVVLLVSKSATTSDYRRSTPLSRTMEKEMAIQARATLLQKLYAPVEELRRRGDLQGALLKLEELDHAHPGEPHGYILKGELLQQTGAIEEAVSSYVEGVKLNGDYIDKKNPLSHRETIKRAADEGGRVIGAKVKANPQNVSLAESFRKVNYLKSRLAGGCE